MADTNQIALIGQYQACAFVAWKLLADCTVSDTPGNKVVGTAIATATLTPEIQDGIEISAENACGGLDWQVKQQDRIKWWNLDLELTTWDYELLVLMVGGALVIGKTGDVAATKVIGWSAPGYNDGAPNGVGLEIYSQVAFSGTGFCPPASVVGAPAYIRHILGKCVFQLADRPFTSSDGAYMKMTGRCFANDAFNTFISGALSGITWRGATAIPAGSAYTQVFAAALPASANTIGGGVEDVDLTP